ALSNVDASKRNGLSSQLNYRAYKTNKQVLNNNLENQKNNDTDNYEVSKNNPGIIRPSQQNIPESNSWDSQKNHFQNDTINKSNESILIQLHNQNGSLSHADSSVKKVQDIQLKKSPKSERTPVLN